MTLRASADSTHVDVTSAFEGRGVGGVFVRIFADTLTLAQTRKNVNNSYRYQYLIRALRLRLSASNLNVSHPPLPAACPAAWPPPHPPLRLAHRLHPQDQSHARSRTPERRRAARRRQRRRTRRLLSAMPLLRRTHDRHRDVRTLEAAARTAAGNSGEPGDRLMTRHGTVQASAAGAAPPATGLSASFAMIGTATITPGRATGRLCHAEVQRSGLTAPDPVHSGKAPAFDDISRRSKSP